MRFDVLTLFPEMFSGYLSQSILKLAQQRGLVEVHLWNLRDWATGKHKSVDDRPFGGGPGMVMMPGPVFDCVEAVQSQAEPGELGLLTPAGARLTRGGVEVTGGEEGCAAGVRPLRGVRRADPPGVEAPGDFGRRLRLQRRRGAGHGGH